MRILATAILALMVSASTYAETEGFSRVELVQELAADGMERLLGWSGGNIYWAKKDGAVVVIDKNGKSLHTLQAEKDKGKPLLVKPEAIAVANETVYVVDSETDRVVMFDFQGNLKGSFGEAGGSALSSPSGIAIHEGIVYVADSGNKRVQLYGINGVFLTTLEIDSAPENTAKSDTEFPYRLKEPTDVEIDAMGQIYVLDADDDRVKVYSASGVYLRHLPDGGKPVDISMAQDGLYVADQESFAINKYDFNGGLLYSFGSEGKGRAQFRSLSGLATDQGRQVYVGDSKKGIADVFMVEANSPIESLAKTPSRTSVRWDQVMPASLGKIVWDGKATIYGIDESDKKSGKIVKITDGAVSGEISLGGLIPASIALDKSGALWVLDGKKSRLVKLDAEGNILTSLGSSGSKKGQFDDAEDLAITAGGIIFIADSGNSRVQAFSSDGVFLKEISKDSTGKLDEPTAIALDAQDSIYVLDKGRSTVSMYTPKGEPLWVIGKQAGNAALKKPLSLAVAGGELFVLDSNQVKVFSRKGQYIRSFAAGGSNLGSLSEPVAVAATGDMTFAISERGNKRLQAFTTLHKPPAPLQLSAKGAVHAVELSWSPNSLPYVNQFRIYRSLAEDTGFAEIATSKANQYTDQGLDPDAKYFYRVAAESQHGYIGPKSDSVNGVAQKYVPPMPTNVQVESSQSQIKLSWSPIDSAYFSVFRIFQKTGEEFIPLGETNQTGFVKDMLASNTHYIFYITTGSTDGTESDKFKVVATTASSSSAPLEIEVVKLQDIFSNTYKLYEQEGVGRVKVTNNTDRAIESIKVSFTLKDFMDYPTEGKIGKLQPGQSEEVVIKAVFNNNILNVTEDSPMQALIEASYFLDGARQVYSKNASIMVYDKHRMTWDEHDRVASFVTPKDTPIINFSRSVVTQFGEIKDESQLAALLFNAMGVGGFTYTQNPTNPYQVSLAKTETTEKTDTVDYVQYPRETLERRSGDCVDLVTFYATALEGLGIRTLMVEVPDHLLMMFSTGTKADADGYTMNNMFVIHEGMLWIPVEVTVVGRPFIKAWELGAEEYYKWQNKGLSILDVQKSWKKFKPSTLPNSSMKSGEIDASAFEKKFPGDFSSMLKISSQTKTRLYLQAIQNNPNDMDAHLQVGIILAKIGDKAEAMKYFDKVIGAQPQNASAMNNRGNLFMLEGKHSEAQEAYLAATHYSPEDPFVWINLAKSYKALNDTVKAKEAFVAAEKLDPAVKEKYKAMALELLNAL